VIDDGLRGVGDDVLAPENAVEKLDIFCGLERSTGSKPFVKAAHALEHTAPHAEVSTRPCLPRRRFPSVEARNRPCPERPPDEAFVGRREREHPARSRHRLGNERTRELGKPVRSRHAVVVRESQDVEFACLRYAGVSCSGDATSGHGQVAEIDVAGGDRSLRFLPGETGALVDDDHGQRSHCPCEQRSQAATERFRPITCRDDDRHPSVHPRFAGVTPEACCRTG